MLVLGRVAKQTIHVSGPCVITVIRVSGDKCRIGIDADREKVNVIRGELIGRYPIDSTEPTPAETQLQPDQVAADEFSESGIFADDEAA